MIKIKIKNKDLFDKLEKQFGTSINEATPVFTEKIIGDMNRYVPRDQDFLMNSSMTASDLDNGTIVYNTPYAAYQYYGVDHNFSKAKNPLASAKWDEKANAVHSGEWSNFLAAEIMRRMK